MVYFTKKYVRFPTEKNSELGYERFLPKMGPVLVGVRVCCEASTVFALTCDDSDNTRIFFISSVILTVKLICFQLKINR